MLKESQVHEIRKFLENCSNPLFFYDDDPDGLCSYVLLRRKYGKGHGVPVKGMPLIDASCLRKVEENYPDLIVILDKALVDQDFLDECSCPVLWIDHHPPIIRHKVHYYNSKLNNSELPTTGLCYQIVNQDIWLATLGCLADSHIPYFYKEAQKQYPDLLPENQDLKEILTKSRFGELIKKSFMVIKGKSNEIRSVANILTRIETPYEILDSQSPQGVFLTKRANKFLKEYNEVLNEAKKAKTKDKILLFIYNAKKTSFTAELSNDLMNLYPEKVIIVGRIKADNVKLSFRSLEFNLAEIIEKSLMNVKGYGGGHDHACGGNIVFEDFNRFMDNFTNLINEEIHKKKK